ncbi:MAG: TonB-dependent receptor plug domain-containing protein, partial [Sphingomonadaceae bacterium]|nr:TonB-dependent receptor plug domain-containing protein [Sphingomonadaceae bacterium]
MHPRLPRLWLSAPLCLAAAIAVPDPAFAQSASPDAPAADIVVTAEATKSGVPLKETPQSVSIVDRAQLDQLNVQTVEEALRYVPSVQSETGGNRGFDNILIRGFNQSAYEYRDGLRLDPGYVEQQEPYGLERLEVLKGPASVLYGQISPGGLVNFISKQPRADLKPEVMLEGGSYGQFAAGADVGGRLGSGHVLWRLTGLYRRSDDPQPYVSSERVFIAPALSWQSTAGIKLTLLAVYQDDRLTRNIGLPVAGTIAPNPRGPIPRFTFLGEPSLPRFDGPQYQVAVLAEQRLAPGWTLRAKARFLHYDLTGPLITPYALEADNRTVDRSGLTFGGGTGVVSTDTQVEGVFDTGRLQHRVLVGVDYLHNANFTRYTLLNVAPIDAYAPVYTGAPATGPEFRSRSQLEQIHPYAQYRLTFDE